jgi:hypothetical protein
MPAHSGSRKNDHAGRAAKVVTSSIRILIDEAMTASLAIDEGL